MRFSLIILIDRKSIYNAESPIVFVVRKAAQLNIKYRKKWSPMIDVCTGAHLTMLRPRSYRIVLGIVVTAR